MKSLNKFLEILAALPHNGWLVRKNRDGMIRLAEPNGVRGHFPHCPITAVAISLGGGQKEKISNASYWERAAGFLRKHSLKSCPWGTMIDSADQPSPIEAGSERVNIRRAMLKALSLPADRKS